MTTEEMIDKLILSVEKGMTTVAEAWDILYLFRKEEQNKEILERFRND